MSFTEQEQQDIIREAMSERVNLMCGKHFYAGPSKNNPEIKPHPGCSQCWQVYFIKDIASVPPSMRAQRLDELEEVLHHMNEMVEKGTWDFEPYEHAKIEITEE